MYNQNQSLTALPVAIDLSQIDLPSAGQYITVSGDYLTTVTKVEVKSAASNANNLMIVATHRIVEGELAGSNFVDRLNIVNSNPDTQRIAIQTLKAYAVALGIDGTISDAQQLVNGRNMRVHVQASEERSKKDPNKKVWMNQVSNIRNADGSDLVARPSAGGGYQAAPAPSAPAPSAPAPAAPQTQAPQGGYGQPHAPTPSAPAPQAPQANYATPQQQQQPQQQEQWQAPQAPQGGNAPQAPSFVPQQ